MEEFISFKQNVHLVITKQVDTLVVPSPNPLTGLLPLLGMDIFSPLLKKTLTCSKFQKPYKSDTSNAHISHV